MDSGWIYTPALHIPLTRDVAHCILSDMINRGESPYIQDHILYTPHVA